MPKLNGVENKQLFGYQVDKENDSVFFNDEKHVYLDKLTGKQYVSVTTLIKKYEPEFNEKFFAKYKALEALAEPDHFSLVKDGLLSNQIWRPELLDKLNIDKDLFNNKVEEIITEWHTNRDEACDHGTYVHELMENSFYGKSKFDLSNFDCSDIIGDFKCTKGYYPKKLEDGIYPEYLVSWISPDGLCISGQIDLLIKNGTDITILDWKGLDINTPILTENGWKTMGTLTLNDVVFDKNGNKTKILHVSEEHFNPCYEIEFDNGDTLIADEDHRWLISFKDRDKITEKVLTTKELANIMDKKPKDSKYIPKIYNPKPLNIDKTKLPIDPYVLGAWLGDGSKSCGVITNINSKLWDEIKFRGYEISENLSKEDKAEMRTVYGLRTELNKLNLLNNKHIPQQYLLASYEDRLDLLRGLMDTDGFLHKKRKRFVMETSKEWQAREFAQLLSSLGFKPTIFDTINKLNGKEFQGWMCCWTNNKINPFLVRNQKEFNDIKIIKDNNSFRNIVSVKSVPTVTTKCIEVDSPTHTYLAGEHLIVTHNTNKEIKKRGYYNKTKKKNSCLKYPLNNLEHCNFNEYQLQLSTYAYMIEQLNSNVNIKELKIVHINRNGKQTVYPCKYLKREVETMIKHYTKSLRTRELLELDVPYII